MEATQDRIKALRVEEVAERLQVELRTVYRLIHKGELKARKIGRMYRVPLEALDNYLMGREEYDTETLDPAELAAVQRGLADIQAGRVVNWEDLKREHGL
jgi:excisionase family DNA binding protein